MKMSFVLLLMHFASGAAWAAMVWGLPWELLRTWRVAPGRTVLIWGTAAGVGLAWAGGWGTAALAAGAAHTLFIVKQTWSHLATWGWQDRARTTEQQAQLMDLRAQIARLHEQERMAMRIHQTETETQVLGDAFRRFDAMLMTIENHLALGDEARAERLITLFGKHLRGILNEASSPFIRLRDTFESIRNYLTLMEALTDERLMIDLDDGMIEPEHHGRMTRNLAITPWVESQTWPLFEAVELQTDIAQSHLITADLEGGEVVFRLDDSEAFRLKLMGAPDPALRSSQRA